MEIWIFLALLSAVIFALKDVLSKRFFSKYDISPTQMLFEMNFLGVVILLIFFFPLLQFELFFDYWYLFLIKAGAIGTAGFIYFHLLNNYEISSISPLNNLSPLVLLVLTSLFLGEVITFVQFMGILVIVFATYVLELHTTHHDKKKPHHFHFKNILSKPSDFFIKAFIMVTAFSTASVTDRFILTNGVDVATNLYFTCLLILIIYIIYLIKEKRIFQSIKNIVREPHTLPLAVLGLTDMVVILSAIAHPAAILSIIIPLRRTSTLMSALFGGMLFHEKHLKQKFIATLIMILGVTLLVI